MDTAALQIDAETVRLIATASGAVVAGLGGALIGGFFTRRTTRMTLEASRSAEGLRWLREQQLEQDQWHRNQKQIAYERFLLAVENCRPPMLRRELQTGVPAEMSEVLAARTQVKLIGAVSVRRAANTLVEALLQLAHLESVPFSDQRDILLRKYQYTLDQYVQSVRTDLDTTTDEDDQLNLENEDIWRKFLTHEREAVSRGSKTALDQARTRYGGA